ncbi:DUF6364 family protein [Mongoliitalea lutea]|jgi:hypothetical protein|uniref:Antitoxin n=1 Tax=Mongoliitalea lutea TaxID=849756 RepID=A0A8J3CXA5_9BACT|nr:DUF6364 family protein [Mongoliitalea lutea]GHB39744.1 hypothetical protein GCM10008106_21090 [Mongoliitalea lutea]
MDKKLTLKLDSHVIEKAKEYAASQNRSLSGLIESYLMKLISEGSSDTSKKIEISPFVKSLRTGVKVPLDYDYKKAHLDFLEEKYK